MVDGELWTRFFLHAQLYSVDAIISGYRGHAGNRAVHNYDVCLAEMERAVSDMREACPQEVLQLALKLQRLKAINNLPLGRVLPLNRLIRRLVNSDIFNQVDYRNIFYEDEEWVERRLPFTL